MLHHLSQPQMQLELHWHVWFKRMTDINPKTQLADNESPSLQVTSVISSKPCAVTKAKEVIFDLNYGPRRGPIDTF